MQKSKIGSSCMAVLLIIAMLATLIPMVQAVTPHAYAAGETVASIDFSSGKTDGTNMSLHVATNVDAITEAKTIGGSQCRYVPSGNYAYFKVSDTAVPSTQKNMFIEVTYYDNTTNGLSIDYNAAGTGTGANYKRAEIGRTNSGKWSTVKFIIDDASFRNAQNNSADFRISGVVYLKSIKITFDSVDLSSTNLGKRTGGSTYSEFSGKTVAGYQSWFGTGGKDEGWTHWGNGQNKWPMPGNSSFDVYPTVDEYDDSILAQTGFANLGNGNPSKLFSSQTENAINTHFKWMADYGIDGAALQRFSPSISGRAISDPTNHLYTKIKNAAEKNKRIFYIMYDISGGNASSYVDDMKFDWIYNVEQGSELLNSPSYATVDGKPVVCIWGFGVPDRITNDYQKVVDFFKSRNCYVILGVNDNWRTQSAYINTFKQADMISPWYVGRFDSNSGADDFYNKNTKADVTFCKQNNIDYYPVIWSGFSWATWLDRKPNMIPRNTGNFIWHQATALKNIGLSSYYVAMFDEYDEGTAIMKSASDYFDIPTDQYFVTGSADGYWVSNDFQLRTVQNIIKMGKGEIQAGTDNPTVASLGPVYYRNSFESRYANCVDEEYNGDYPIDPGMPTKVTDKTENVTGAKVEIIKTDKAKTGSYVARITGTASGKADCRITFGKVGTMSASSGIKINRGMTISYNKYAVNDLGKYAGIYFKTDDGQAYTYVESADAKVGQWTDGKIVIGTGDLVGKTVKEIGLCEMTDNGTGTFDAYFDDIIIEDGEDIPADPCDLYVSDAAMSPSGAVDGDKILPYATIRNMSDVDCTGNVSIQFRVDGRIIDTVTYTDGIKAGGKATVYASSSKAVTAFFGSHTVKVSVSSTQEDTDKSNNLIKRRFAIKDN